MFRNTRYVIAVHDLEGAARFYRDALGFTIHEIPDPGWLFFVRDECFIMAGRCPDSLLQPNSAIIRISRTWKSTTSRSCTPAFSRAGWRSPSL